MCLTKITETSFMFMNAHAIYKLITSFNSQLTCIRYKEKRSSKIWNKFYLDQASKNEFEKSEFSISSSKSKIPELEDIILSILGWNTSACINHSGPENERRIPSFPSKCRNRVFYCFQCYKKLQWTCWIAKARCTPTFVSIFKIVVAIFFQKEDQFRNLIPMFGDFHTEKCLQQSIAKYIRGSGLEETLHRTCVFAVKLSNFVLDGTHCVQSLKGLLIVVNAIKKLKWSAFTQICQSDSTVVFESSMRSLQEAYLRNDSRNYKRYIKHLQTSQLQHLRWYDT